MLPTRLAGGPGVQVDRTFSWNRGKVTRPHTHTEHHAVVNMQLIHSYLQSESFQVPEHKCMSKNRDESDLLPNQTKTIQKGLNCQFGTSLYTLRELKYFTYEPTGQKKTGVWGGEMGWGVVGCLVDQSHDSLTFWDGGRTDQETHLLSTRRGRQQRRQWKRKQVEERAGPGRAGPWSRGERTNLRLLREENLGRAARGILR